MTRKKVVVAGHVCLDITPVFPPGKQGEISDFLRPGKLILTRGTQVSPGGSVANTGLAMKFLGADVSLMGKVGNDAFGSVVLEAFGRWRAEKDMIVSEGESTSCSVVLAPPGVDRIFLYQPGANDTFGDGDIPDRALREADLFHFGYPPLLRRMYERDGEELAALFHRAKGFGTVTSLDLASVDADSDAGRADWETILQRIMPDVDLFVPSAEELCFMLDRRRFEEWQSRAAGGDVADTLEVERDVGPLADRCMALGARVLLIKCGSRGIYYRTAPRERLEGLCRRFGLDVSRWAEMEGLEESYVPDRVLSGTGAGDTCIAAFLTAMLEGMPLDRCLHLAAAEGASCLTAYDALGGLLPLDALDRKIDAGWPKRGAGRG